MELQSCHLSQVKPDGKIHEISGVSPACWTPTAARHNDDMRILLVSGGDGESFARALGDALGPDDTLDVIAPVVRDHWSAWLKASPDLDALLVRPGVPATHAVADELTAIDFSPVWQRADDQTVAARLVRTELIGSGFSLTEATVAASARAALPYRLVPMAEDRAEMHVVVGGDEPHAIHVEEYLADPATHAPSEILLVTEGISVSSTVSAALAGADVLVLGPSSRTLAIDPVLRTPGLREAIRADLPVLVVEHDDAAPADLVRVAGLREPDPGSAEPIADDVPTVLGRARELAA